MTGWTLDDIPWHRFDPQAVDADLLAVVKTAALVEANAADYVAYLSGVFADDPVFLAQIARWGVEEEQHGAALGRWAELAEPGFDFARALADFRAGFRVPQGLSQSIRGSRGGELAFMTGSPGHHHQFVIVSGRAPEGVSTVNQLSFKVPDLDALKTLYGRAREAGMRCAYVTNNASRPPGTVVAHLRDLGIALEDLHTIFSQVSFVNVVALDELLSAGGEKGDKLSLVDTLEDTKAEDPVSAFEGEETKYLLSRAINQLPEREKIVVTLYYYEGLTLAEIGRVLGVTESRICQMHTKAVVQLRAKLAEVS